MGFISVCCRRRDDCWDAGRWGEERWAGGRRWGGYWVAAHRAGGHRVRQTGEDRRRVCIRRRDGDRRPWEGAEGAGVHGADGGGGAVGAGSSGRRLDCRAASEPV